MSISDVVEISKAVGPVAGALGSIVGLVRVLLERKANNGAAPKRRRKSPGAEAQPGDWTNRIRALLLAAIRIAGYGIFGILIALPAAMLYRGASTSFDTSTSEQPKSASRSASRDGFTVVSPDSCSREGRRVRCDFRVENGGDRRIVDFVGGQRTFLIDDQGANLSVTGASVPGTPNWNAGGEGGGMFPPRLETVIPKGSSTTLTLYFSDVGSSVREVTLFTRWRDLPQAGTSVRTGENAFLFEELNIPVK